MLEKIYERVLELLKNNEEFALVHLFLTKGSTPNDAGSKMIVFKNGKSEFTIGGGPFEASVIADAVEAIKEGKSIWKNYTLTEEQIKMRCGGTAYVYIDVHLRPCELIIFGGGHIGKALVEMASLLNLFRITIIDDRKEFISEQRHPKANHRILINADYTEPLPNFTDKSFIVIATRCHDIDMKVLKNIIDKPKAYLGMLGSQKKVKEIFEILEKEGIDGNLLKQVHAPVGLPIGGKSPSEIALSILAEIIKVKNNRN